MAQTASAAVAASLALRNALYLPKNWQGGVICQFARQTSPGVKTPYYTPLGLCEPKAGASFDLKATAAEFENADATGVIITEGKPISKLDVPIAVKLKAPSMTMLAMAMFSTAPTAVTQDAVTEDTQVTITGATTPFAFNVWYPLGYMNITQINVSKNVSSTFTTLDNGATSGTPDYQIDTELGMIMFFNNGTNTLAGTEVISILLQAGALTSMPQITPRVSPIYIYGGVQFYIVNAANEARQTSESWLRYVPLARLEPTGKFDITADKSAEIDVMFTPVPSTEISGAPFGYLKQIAGVARAITP
jgi:hypothetical protein